MLCAEPAHAAYKPIKTFICAGQSNMVGWGDSTKLPDDLRKGNDRVLMFENGRYMTRQARQGIFRASDANGDDVVSEEEYITNRIITDEAKVIMSGMDADSDGRVAQEEFLEHSGLPKDLSNAVFNEFDTDGNGELVIPEYLRVWGRWARCEDED
jgi:Ca2+-binding EF-hand superfamily protein